MQNFASRLNMIQRGQNFFQPELLILSQGGWGSDQIPKQALPWNCQNTWDKILDQSAKKIWARSSFKQQTLANDILLDSGSRDPTCCIINVHFSVLRSCLLYLLYLWSNECSSHPFLFPSFITWCTIAHGMAWPISLICLYFFSKQHISYIHIIYTSLIYNITSSCPKPEQELLNNITHSMLAGKSDEAFSLWWHFYTPARLRKLFHLRKVTAINNILGQRESSRRLCSNDGPRNSETLTKLKYTLNFARPLRSLARKVRNRKWVFQ